MIEAMSFDLSPDLKVKLNPLLQRSMGSDNANAAKAAVRIVGEFKTKHWEETPQEVKDAMTPEARKLAEAWDGTTCQLHLLNVFGMGYVGPLLERKKGGAKIPHGKTEHHVQKTLMATDILFRHLEKTERRQTLHKISRRKKALSSDDKKTLYKWAWKVLSSHWHESPPPFRAADIPSASSGLYSAAKLFGHTGDASKYHLNESRLLRSWSKANGVVQQRLWKACKTHRFGWNFECAEVLVLNSNCMLPMLHKLRVCTAKPNKLVVCVWNTLSCKYTMAAHAARAVMNRFPPSYLPSFAPNIFPFLQILPPPSFLLFLLIFFLSVLSEVLGL